ncbi:MAG: class I mannose-6-phosphate isomerase [Chthoniobacterales bacterium]|nr:class I mannose-6-phosphate isomerase [Chthoniobacterales bacterium]
MERIWGGRRLESLYGKKLPGGLPIGESWELVDRAEAQSVVQAGPWRGRTLHDLWQNEREQVFGAIADAPRFPVLIKLLDAQDTLSVQVHPPAAAAVELGGEPKTEFWYIAEAKPTAELYVGLKAGSSRADFEGAIQDGTADEHLHRLPVRAGDGMFLPSGRVHAIGAGNVILEIQQNSDTTYRVFDWNRTDNSGSPRELHIEQSLRAIDFDDCEPALVQPSGEAMVRHDLFHIDKWSLDAAREGAAPGEFAIFCCLTGGAECAGISLPPGGLFLLPASLHDRTLRPSQPGTTLVRVTVPGGA